MLGLYGLYMTGLFGWLMGSHVGHVAMQVHFMVSGYLFYWVLIGIDPRPKPTPYWGRLLLLLLALSVHGFFAVALMMDTTPLAAEWYGIVRPTWVTDPLRDTLNGGQVAWGLAEIPTVIVLVAIAVQWSRSDDREAVRADRQADRDDDAELRAYNEHLAALARRDQRGADRARATVERCARLRPDRGARAVVRAGAPAPGAAAERPRTTPRGWHTSATRAR